MSTKFFIPGWVLESKELTPGSKLILSVLNTRSTETPEGRISRGMRSGTVSDLTGMHGASTDRLLKSLEKDGYIKTVKSGYLIIPQQAEEQHLLEPIDYGCKDAPVDGVHPWTGLDKKQIGEYVKVHGVSLGMVLMALTARMEQIPDEFFMELREKILYCQNLNYDLRPETVWTVEKLKEAAEYKLNGAPTK